MEGRTFELILHKATGLPDVRELGRMKVYAKISISGDSESELVTPVDREGETNPCWNSKIMYTLVEEAVQVEERSAKLVIRLYCKRLLGDRYVGEVNISLKRLFDYSKSGENISYDIDKFDEEGTFGKLNISYKFGEKIIVQKPSMIGKILKGAFIVSKVGLEVVQVMLQ